MSAIIESVSNESEEEFPMNRTQPISEFKRHGTGIRATAICAAILLAVSGCLNPVTQNKTIASATKGTILLKIPSIASWIVALQQSAKAAQSQNSRAFAFVTSVTIEVDSSGATVISPTSYPTTGTSGSLPIAITVPSVPIGTGYTVKVSVYNSNTGSSPVVEGQIAGVAVTAGNTTNVSITCIPVSSTTFTLGSGTIAPSLGSSAEQWYSMQVTSGTTYYFTQSAANFGVGVFDNNGTYLNSGASFVEYTATFTGTLYFAVVNMGTTTGSASLAISTTAPTLGEGTIASPVSLTMDTTRTFKVGPASSGSTSYYSFTTGAAGTYVFDTYGNSGYLSATIYSDPTFTTVVGTQIMGQNGEFGYPYIVLGGNLYASTSYYLAVTNLASSPVSFPAGVFDPTALASDMPYVQGINISSGFSSNPLSLTLDEPISASVDSLLRISNYTFTTGTGSNYSLSATNLSPAVNNSNLDFDIYTDSAFTQWIDWVGTWDGNTMALPPLSPNTTYYVRATNQFSTVPVSYTLEVVTDSPPSTVTLPTDGTWTPGSVTSANSGSAWYAAAVTAGQTYALYWDEQGGSGTYTGSVSVSAYEGDMLTPYFTQNWNVGYAAPAIISVPSGQSTVNIFVTGGGTSSGPGTFALKMVVSSPGGILPIAVGSIRRQK
jgi:hypothetical protein